TKLRLLNTNISEVYYKYKMSDPNINKRQLFGESCRRIGLFQSQRHPHHYIKQKKIIMKKRCTGGKLLRSISAELKYHEPKCEHGLFRCPFATISKQECSWSGSMYAIKDHVKQHHDDKSVQYVSKKFKTMLHNVEKSQRFYQTFITMDELFYVKWVLYKGYFHCAVFYVGPYEKSSDYKYRFSITTNDGETVTGCSRTHSFLDDVENVLRQGKCIKLNHAIVQRSYTDNGHLPFRMEISKIIDNKNVNVNRMCS
ncbi:hypothetical protein L9F63_006730, partial [Diploptera punctata]